MVLFYCLYLITCYVLGSPKSSIRFFQKMRQKNLNKIFGKPSMYVVCLVTQSSVTLCNPMDYSTPGSSLSMGFSRQEDWSIFLGISQTQGLNPCLQCLLHWQVDYLPLSHMGNPYLIITIVLSFLFLDKG